MLTYTNPLYPIYTAGYSGYTPGQLLQAAQSLGSEVIDIRAKPFSRVPGWSAAELARLFGGRYGTLHALGNQAIEDGGEMCLYDADYGLKQVELAARRCPQILLCGCANFADCHRALVSRMLGERGIKTSELRWPVIERADALPALSLWQPYATLIALKAKQFETRGWATDYRGPLAVHAAKNVSELRICATEPFYSILSAAGYVKLPPHLVGASQEDVEGAADEMPKRRLLELFPLPLGAIVAVANVADCLVMDKALIGSQSAQERDFGDWSNGRYAWEMADVKRLREPIEQRGAQKLFNVSLPENVMRRVKGEMLDG